MGGRFEMQKGCIKNHPWEEASLERYSPYLALRRPVPTGRQLRFLQVGVLNRREQTEQRHMYHSHSRTGARNEYPGGIKILPATTGYGSAVAQL